MGCNRKFLKKHHNIFIENVLKQFSSNLSLNNLTDQCIILHLRKKSAYFASCLEGNCLKTHLLTVTIWHLPSLHFCNDKYQNLYPILRSRSCERVDSVWARLRLRLIQCGNRWKARKLQLQKSTCCDLYLGALIASMVNP